MEGAGHFSLGYQLETRFSPEVGRGTSREKSSTSTYAGDMGGTAHLFRVILFNGHVFCGWPPAGQRVFVYFANVLVDTFRVLDSRISTIWQI